MTINVLVTFSLALAFFIIIDRTIGNRVLAEVEWSGLDALEMGSEAYPTCEAAHAVQAPLPMRDGAVRAAQQE